MLICALEVVFPLIFRRGNEEITLHPKRIGGCHIALYACHLPFYTFEYLLSVGHLEVCYFDRY